MLLKMLGSSDDIVSRDISMQPVGRVAEVETGRAGLEVCTSEVCATCCCSKICKSLESFRRRSIFPADSWACPAM